MFQRVLMLPCMLLLLTAIPVVAAADDDNNHIALQLNLAAVDDDRRVDGNGLGATFIYGFPLQDRFWLEGRVTGLVLERGDSGGTDFYQQDLGVDAVYRFGNRDEFQPFVLAGLSAIRNDVDIDEQDSVELGANIGGGILSGPLGRLGFRLRADVRYVFDQFLDGMQDIRVGIGVHVPLGANGGPSFVDSGRRSTGTGTDSDDRDGDGVPDDADRCLNSLSYVRHDTSGCMMPNQTIRLYEVTFNNGTAILTPEARAELQDLVLALRGQPSLPIRIHGHTDSWGDKDENERLSLERAEAVATWLTLQGIPTQRLNVKGFGESLPVDTNTTREGRERNRRIEVVLLPPESR